MVQGCKTFQLFLLFAKRPEACLHAEVTGCGIQSLGTSSWGIPMTAK
jgi:hypothetical protein